jgi:4-aminobutyrate aminotransferase-like enzyme
MSATTPHAAPAPSATATLASRFRQTPAVRAAIKTIVDEAQKHAAQITDVRGPVSDAAKLEFDTLMADAAAARGRGLLYPYIASGLGHGPLVELVDGSVKYDMIAGIGVHFFGHSDPDLMAHALDAATGDTAQQGHLMPNDEAIRLNKIIVEEASRHSNLRHAFLCNSGAMANENALKVCYQKHAPASRVIAFAHCFMGRSVTMAQIGDSAAGRQGIPLSTQVDYLPFFDHVAARRMSAGDVSGSTRYIDMVCYHLEQYIERYPKQHACMIFELVQGEGGFNTALPDFHRALMTICKAHNIAVWDDEVQTFGRTEKMFCFDALGLGDMVDVCCIGKMSQVCAALYTPEYNPQAGLLSGTFLGGSVELRVGRRIIERLRDGNYYGPSGIIRQHHDTFTKHVRDLAARHPDWFGHNPQVPDIVGGFGGMMRFTPFAGAKDPIMKLCRVLFDEGIVAFYCGHDPYHLRFLPPLGVMRLDQWPRVFQLVESAMAKVAAALPAPAPAAVRPMHQPFTNGAKKQA